MAVPSQAEFGGCLAHHLVTREPPCLDVARNPTSFTFVQDLVFVSDEVCPSQKREQDATLVEEESAIPLSVFKLG